MATDSSGNAVTDLRKEELQLQDNRKPQAIASFVVEGVAPTAGANASAAPEEQTREEYAMLLIDWRNPRYFERVNTLDFAKLLLEKFQPRQELAIYIYARKSYLLHDFTIDRGALAQQRGCECRAMPFLFCVDVAHGVLTSLHGEITDMNRPAIACGPPDHRVSVCGNSLAGMAARAARLTLPASGSSVLSTRCLRRGSCHGVDHHASHDSHRA